MNILLQPTYCILNCKVNNFVFNHEMITSDFYNSLLKSNLQYNIFVHDK